MNTLHPNSDQIPNPDEVQSYFQSDPQLAAVAATYLYFQGDCQTNSGESFGSCHSP